VCEECEVKKKKGKGGMGEKSTVWRWEEWIPRVCNCCKFSGAGAHHHSPSAIDAAAVSCVSACGKETKALGTHLFVWWCIFTRVTTEREEIKRRPQQKRRSFFLSLSLLGGGRGSVFSLAISIVLSPAVLFRFCLTSLYLFFFLSFVLVPPWENKCNGIISGLLDDVL